MRLRASVSLAAMLWAVAANGQNIGPQGAAGGQAPFIGTGGSVATSGADRSTYKGARLDMRADFGAKCDGATNDTSAFTSMIAKVGATATPTTITFPGACLVTYANNVLTGALSFEGVSGGGIKLAAGATMTADFLHWQSGSNAISLKNFTLNLNGAVPSGGIVGATYFAPGQSLVVDHSQIINGGATPSGAGLILIEGYGLTSCSISNSNFSVLTATIYQSQSINLGASGYPVNHCDIHDNTSANTGFGIFWADNTHIWHNEIYGWGFGGGITLGPSDNNDHNILVESNNIHDSAALLDVNTTYLNGIENWFYDAHIVGNKIRNTCGPGIGVGGRSTVVGNRISNVGSCAANNSFQDSGIVSTYDGVQSGSYSSIFDNTVFDDGGNTQYGYSDTASVTGVALGVNDFQGASGAYNISGGSYFTAPQIDNRLINACAVINQRNGGNVINAGWVTDQWGVTASHGYMQIQTSTGVRIAQCNTSIRMYVQTQTTPASGDYLSLHQNLSASDVMDFNFQLPNARNLIFSFCGQITTSTPYTGSYALQNTQSGYSYVGNYTITAPANTTQCFSVRVPGDPSHYLSWFATAGTPMSVVFDLGSGSSVKTSTLNSWVSGSYVGSTTATPLVSLAVGTVLNLSDFRLLPATADLGWMPRSPQEELIRSQRFFQTSFVNETNPTQNAGLTGAICSLNPISNGQPSLSVQFGQTMNTTPTITTFNPLAANANWRDTTSSADVAISVPTNGKSQNGFTIGTSAAVGAIGDNLCIHYTADAGL